MTEWTEIEVCDKIPKCLKHKEKLEDVTWDSLASLGTMSVENITDMILNDQDHFDYQPTIHDVNLTKPRAVSKKDKSNLIKLTKIVWKIWQSGLSLDSGGVRLPHKKLHRKSDIT